MILKTVSSSQQNKAWEPSSAQFFCSQPYKQVSAQGHNNISINKA